jgi:hypothetical protein
VKEYGAAMDAWELGEHAWKNVVGGRGIRVFAIKTTMDDGEYCDEVLDFQSGPWNNMGLCIIKI